MHILFDPVRTRQNLLPLTYTRPIAECRVGIMTIREKWEHYIGLSTQTLSEPYLAVKYPLQGSAGPRIYINASVLPNEELYNAIKTLAPGQTLKEGSTLIAFNATDQHLTFESINESTSSATEVKYPGKYSRIDFPYDIFRLNGAEIEADFKILIKGHKSLSLSKTNVVIGDTEQVFLGEGASVECATLNTKAGPIYIGKDTEIMEGCHIRGPFALCDHAGLKMAAKIYGATTIGPHCRVGGEVSNGVFFGYSNKGHDGFLGNSVIGEWCNLGADTNTSNLKNNYGNVEVWNYAEEKQIPTDMQFHGLIMGDHAKSGINTMFNTGTVVGVAANVFDGGFPAKFVPSFTWGGAAKTETFLFGKALEVATRMMERRGVKLEQADIDILNVAYERDAKYRK